MMTFEHEVDWFEDERDELEEFRKSCFKDETFREYIIDFGVKRCLYLATSLHREVADQLRLQNDNNVTEEYASWRIKAVRVATEMKKRRQQLRRAVRGLYGEEAVEEINEQVLRESEDLS